MRSLSPVAPPPDRHSPARARAGRGKTHQHRSDAAPSGAITLSWDAINAAASSGTFYNINRTLPGQSSFTGIDGGPGSTSVARRMNFTDSSVPTSAPANGAQYVIQGQRGTQTGEPCDAITVQFGVDGGGGFNAVGAKATDLKMAA